MGRWSFWVAMLAVLLGNLWLRGHAFGPSIQTRTGWALYPVTSRESEPLDCDEAIYGHIGDRLVRGAVIYRDLTENKPPGGYWMYALGVALGGPTELTVRLLPVPFVLATTLLVGLVGHRLAGAVTGVVAAGLFALVSTDPFLYGESANMEHMVNLFAFSSLALLLAAWDRPGRTLLAASGAALACACMVKQTAVLHAPIYALALLVRREVAGPDGRHARSRGARAHDLAALTVGFGVVVGLTALLLVVQGAGRPAFNDIVRYGGALAAETPPPPGAPPWFVRWFTGNADPRGMLPWPFGSTDYLVWWGTGTWPVWLAAVPAVGWLVVGKGANASRRLVAAWTLSTWVQVALPGLFWQHYYLLPLPGLALAVAVLLSDQARLARASGRCLLVHGAVAIALVGAVAWTVRLQVVEYLLVPPEALVRDRGGPQWLANRALGREIARRTRGWHDPRLFVWGWQGPLYFYSGLDGVTPQVFVDDFLKNFATTGHPLVRPRIERTMRDLEAHRPALIFTGYAPFPALRDFLQSHYLPSRLAPGLWVERGHFRAFEDPVAP